MESRGEPLGRLLPRELGEGCHTHPGILQGEVEVASPCAWHRWDLPVLHYREIMVIYPYPFLVVITQLFSCVIFINDCIRILTGLPG